MGSSTLFVRSQPFYVAWLVGLVFAANCGGDDTDASGSGGRASMGGAPAGGTSSQGGHSGGRAEHSDGGVGAVGGELVAGGAAGAATASGGAAPDGGTPGKGGASFGGSIGALGGAGGVGGEGGIHGDAGDAGSVYEGPYIPEVPACGDGVWSTSEGCDDGNLVDGDGCSAACTIEPNAICDTAYVVHDRPCTNSSKRCLSMPVTYRDFDGQNLATGHPDFFYVGATPPGGSRTLCVPNASGANALSFSNRGTCPGTDATDRCTGLASPHLTIDGKPTLGDNSYCKCSYVDWEGTGILTDVFSSQLCMNGAQSVRYAKNLAVKSIQSAETFAQWFTDSDLSTKVERGIELTQIGNSELYTFSMNGGRTVADDLHDIWLTSQSLSPSRRTSSLSSGFYPLEDTGRPKLCNLFPYWAKGLDTANCIASAGNPVTAQWDARAWPSANAGGPQPNEVLGAYVTPVVGKPRNFYFTSEIHFPMVFYNGEQISIVADDDTWVYIAGTLVLDMGGTHERTKGTITGQSFTSFKWTVSAYDPATGAETQLPGSAGAGSVNVAYDLTKVPDIAIFHAERSPRESEFQLTVSGWRMPRADCRFQ